MEVKEIENHGYIKLIKFSLTNKSFNVAQALEASGMGLTEFNSAKYAIFNLRGEHEQITSLNQVFRWELAPQAFFHYVSFLEYKHAITSSRRAQIFAIIAIIISAISIAIGLFI